ncbi:MAG: hypothetical protein JXA33_28940 [Anaerolineae bacterium]|nr:hypothetical protein [Anaerolineae bacterium]
MPTVITPKITPQGVLIPREAVQEWLEEGVEVVKHERQIVIQPQSVSTIHERALAVQALREDGLLVDSDRVPLFPQPSMEERAALARKLAVGRPLSELVMEERKAGW